VAKSSLFICSECGYETRKWLGKCPECGSWNTLIEEIAAPKPAAKPLAGATGSAQRLDDIVSAKMARVSTGIGELDRVLGGGLIPGSSVLLGGDPGIGKSTLLLQVASALCAVGKVLYVTGEESAAQIKLRADRLGLGGAMFVLAQTDMALILAHIESMSPDFIIIDSIQTMQLDEISSAPGSVSQVREATSRLTRIAKTRGAAVFIVGHVTKEGAIAGPKVLEHMVDAVLYFEGERHDSFRILRTVKNRYGSTNEIGVFEMRDSGMHEVADPSELFISRRKQAAGCAITCAMEGTRPIMVELQALLSSTAFTAPRRTAMGLDASRLILMLAVLEKKAGLKFYDKDVYINVVGGLWLDERANDLAIAMCIASCLSERPLKKDTVVIGEVGLTGEIRHVSRLPARVAECVRLGFKRIIVPECDLRVSGAELIPVTDIADAIAKLF
jgi:DNA repair protein RadA/Sms